MTASGGGASMVLIVAPGLRPRASASSGPRAYDPPMHVLVVGAGAFGSWTARWLLRRGASVTLVDQYGAGNSLASSGDESRVTRSAHGADMHYPVWQRRALEQWLALDRSLFVPTGVVWLAHREDGFEADSLRALERLGIPAERLEPDALHARLPQMRTDDVASALH